MATIPVGAVVLGALGTFAAIRTLYHPHRAVVADGFVLRCVADPGCGKAMVIESYSGKSPVYATVAGRVLTANATQIILASKDEPVVVTYDADADRGGLDAAVKRGTEVGLGQQIGSASRVEYSVHAAHREPDGKVVWVPQEPASWLAARGLRVSAKRRAGAAQQWCETGRRVTVPQRVGGCGLRLPAPGSFMLLPVNITME
jgi:hypothetical protein